MLPSKKSQVFVYSYPCDMRRSFVSLSMIVKEELDVNPQSGDLFLFFNRNRDYVKMIWWDKTGYCMWAKKLARGFMHCRRSRRSSFRICRRS